MIQSLLPPLLPVYFSSDLRLLSHAAIDIFMFLAKIEIPPLHPIYLGYQSSFFGYFLLVRILIRRTMKF
ncbi:hypothetical protein VNO77_13276 [Canavalia gladiata]|uniref:Uncharacterized protein n=1 Tax=Canavalia gladiata TaxID=3824 RepID=A0AAN9M0T7_CANGL